MNIGNVKIDGMACLAPMAGVADRAFREICKELGASYLVSEMVSSKGIFYDNKKTEDLMFISSKEHPCAIQLFGNEPKTMAIAAKSALKYNPDIIDINMGCPAPKVSNNGCGSALMNDPELCFEIVSAIKAAVNIPVTVKIRKGWDNNNINAVEVAKSCEKAGASAIFIHGRTKKQMYSGCVDKTIIKSVKGNVKIPVIGNGDIVDIPSALDMINQTGCDMIMIGRAALGNPWIFRNINEYFKSGKTLPDPTLKERIEVMLHHVDLICTYKGEHYGIKEARKHVAYYMKGLNNAANFRRQACSLESFEQLVALSKDIYLENS